MIVRFSTELFVDAEDGVSFVLKRTLPATATRKERHETLGYYPTLEQAARRALDHCVLGAEGHRQASDLAGALGRAAARIASACEGAMNAAGAAAIQGESPDEVPADLFAEA